MKKIIIATHHYLAKGFKDTLEYIVPNTVEVIDINAYIDNISIESQILKSLKDFSKDEQIFVFTDLLGGSVNQEFVKQLSESKIELITGVNLPLIITIILQLGENKLSKESIHEAIEEARNQLIYVNDYLKAQEMDEDDE
ncbi:TPA: PTS N-acetylglucosamine transporter subunit IIBC [Enterococcus faecium]|jgi:fructoselysine and glucoselysine-specific PTS system IIA component|uniref:PTS sugar transporter subunit IIA n=1 Tax=Enterococcus TaxID=1350 RepID=UPI00187F16AD|nr:MULTISPECIES: PTS N-acetylglucosamine transporter subunit IIBC [Enterococcus]EGO8075915.1 PTS N-acetylglucosamine transporter subunit IIBC [Enterococcus faecalis]MBE8849367.1 PTS N-acetylglucosamine transporter subunit IIBC [Enterococcus durans]HBK5578356.1 PTS N-acetylglucosamine transporter subunit IIBC [Enterococcus faecium]HBK5597890.1 PTS N-acetylglucosamine transporter subunit IIBC [Enterococcus faecium]